MDLSRLRLACHGAKLRYWIRFGARLRENREAGGIPARAQRCKVDGDANATGPDAGKAQRSVETESEDRPDRIA